MYIFYILSLVFAFGFAKCLGKQVCYKNGVGCFSDNPPWDNMPLPMDPDVIRPNFLLLQKDSAPREITSVNALKLDDLIVMIHGFGGGYNATLLWNYRIHTRLHIVRPTADILFVDWEIGAGLGSGINIYHQPAANARVTAQLLALFLKASPKFDSTKVYCIGFSLGSHVCGMTAKRLGTKWGRISAMDPAAPAYVKADPITRLDASDGLYVDVIHSSWVSLGPLWQLGHKDFYVNSAYVQPGCLLRRRRDFTPSGFLGKILNALGLDADYIDKNIIDKYACSHYRAAYLFSNTIIPMKNCTFLFCPCQSLIHHEKGHCRTCDPAVGAHLGYHSIDSTNQGKFYGYTTDKEPFCLN